MKSTALAIQATKEYKKLVETFDDFKGRFFNTLGENEHFPVEVVDRDSGVFILYQTKVFLDFNFSYDERKKFIGSIYFQVLSQEKMKLIYSAHFDNLGNLSFTKNLEVSEWNLKVENTEQMILGQVAAELIEVKTFSRFQTSLTSRLYSVEE